ncbi:P-loop NTPase fold protein [Nocardia asteroides]
MTSPLGAACAIGIGGMILMGVLAVVAPAAIQTLGTYIVSFGTVGAGAAAWIKNQAAAARRLLEPAERLQLQIEQRVKDARVEQDAEIAELEMRAADAQSDLVEAREHQAKTAEELEAARQAKDELSPARLLERYLAERVASGEYDQHLGVVGVVHRDLLNLSEHLEAAVEDSSSTTKRIILYIDDLDRCSSQTVVEVLEAIHLLLALPLFVVVVGINRRIVDRSLRAHHAELIESDSHAPTSADYLEKIFQLSYTLPNMSVAGCRAVLREAAGAVELVVDEPETAGTEEDIEASNVETTDFDAEAEVYAPRFEPRMVVDESEQQSESDLAQALSLREADLETLDLVAPLVTATPRRAKRFLSVYLVVRARYTSADLDAVSLALAIALLVGVPKSLGPALRLLDAADAEGILLGDWISENASGDESRQAEAFVESAGDALKLPLSKVVEQVGLVSAYT